MSEQGEAMRKLGVQLERMADMELLALNLEGQRQVAVELQIWADEDVQLRARLQRIVEWCGTDYYVGDVGAAIADVLAGKDPRV